MPDSHRYTLPTPTAVDVEPLVARLWAAGAMGVWQRVDELVAWFETRDVDVPAGGSWSLERDRDWQAEWKATISPVTAGRFVIVPTWLADDHRSGDDHGRGDDQLAIVLDPGRAFGSGHHATTTQCLELLQAVAPAGRRVLDVGTGTGILAIGAALLGAREVVAVDVDADAVEVASDNAARNGVAIDVRLGSAADAAGRYDVVLANLVTDTVIALAGPMVDRLEPGGWLIASGIADERRDRAIGALLEAGLQPPRTVSRDGWTALRGRRSVLAGAADEQGRASV
jgi:ribosomal protein L11 methyltransferase